MQLCLCISASHFACMNGTNRWIVYACVDDCALHWQAWYWDGSAFTNLVRGNEPGNWKVIHSYSWPVSKKKVEVKCE